MTQAVRLIVSSFLGRAVQLASHDPKEFAAFCFDPIVGEMAIFQQLSHSYYRTLKHGSESSQEILDSFQRNGVIQAVTLQPIISSAC
jgi:hypothetical protein